MIRIIRAKYGSRCRCCRQDIQIGDRCAWDSSRRVIYHERCAPSGERLDFELRRAQVRQHHGMINVGDVFPTVERLQEHLRRHRNRTAWKGGRT